jgi:hypothetical protein
MCGSTALANVCTWGSGFLTSLVGMFCAKTGVTILLKRQMPTKRPAPHAPMLTSA